MPFDLQILNADSGKFETLPSTWGIGGGFTIKQSTTVKGEGSASGFIELKQVETQAGGYMSYPYNNNSQPRYARLIGDNIGGGSSTNFLKANGFTNDKTSYLKVKIGYQDFNSNISNDANWWVFAPGFRTGETLNDWLNGNMTLETRQRLGKNLTQIAQPSPISSNLLFTELIIRVVDNDFDGVPIIPIIFGTTESLNAQQFAAQVEGFRFFIDQAEQVIYDKITVSGIITNNTNVTNPNGAIDVTIAGGSPDGVTISWNTGESTEDLTGIDQGLYIITVTDNLTGDQVIKEFIVEDDLLDPIVITETKTNPSSPNGNDGSIQLTITGGSGQFSYNWDNGEITKDLSDLTAGDYTITVTDQENGVFESKTITLSDPSEEELDAPLIIYPKANAIRMIKQQEYNASNNPNNSQYSLYCDFNSQIIRRAFYAQPYLKDDLPK
ncbi:MAG: SprB repeat-containing protein, partial [Candidatus Paceibacterota bacterium]